MATIQFGNTAADMRLADDFYGIPALRDSSLFLLTFVAVRQEVVSQSPTQLVTRQWNAADQSITFTATGNAVSNELFVANELAIDALGVLETWRGAIEIRSTGGFFTGTVNEVIVTDIASGSLIAGVSGTTLTPQEVLFIPEERVLAGDDSISSGSGNDYLRGYAGNDSFTGGAGNDTLNGESGSDTANYPGALRQYTVAANGGQVSGSNGTDTLISIEKIVCLDGVLSFDPSGHMAQAYRLYFATLDRAPDVLGLNFQSARLDAGTALAEVAAGFVNSPEFQATYGALDDVQFVGLLYQNVLDRAPLPAEVAFHAFRLQSGASRADVVVGFSESPEHIQKHSDAVNAGLWDIDEGLASVARLYFGMLERAPEARGLSFYEQGLAAGLTVQQVANGFAASPEFGAKYGLLGDPAYVAQLYTNILERAATPGEVNFHVNRLAAGATRGDVAAGFTEAPEYQLKTLPLIDDGIAVADTGFVLT
jgi:hypothetical protein